MFENCKQQYVFTNEKSRRDDYRTKRISIKEIQYIMVCSIKIFSWIYVVVSIKGVCNVRDKQSITPSLKIISIIV